MKRILSLFFIILYINFFTIHYFTIQNLFAESYNKNDEKNIDKDKKREKFLLEMKKLINAATKSGFSKKEVREITVIRDGKVLYVWDFLEQEKLRLKKEELKKKKSKRKERYLSVLDISDELESFETEKLDLIKDKSIFVGADQ